MLENPLRCSSATALIAAVVNCLLLASPTWAESGVSLATAIEGIPLGEVETERRRLWAELRGVEAQLSSLAPRVPSAETLGRFEAFYRDEKARVEEALSDSSTLDGLAEMEAVWRRERDQVDGWMAQLARDLGEIDARETTLRSSIERWTQTLSAARGARVPARLLDDIESSLLDLRGVAKSAERRRAETLLRESRAADANRVVSEVLGLVLEKRRELRGSALQPHPLDEPSTELGGIVAGVGWARVAVRDCHELAAG